MVTTDNATRLICSECGTGNYRFAIPGYVECNTEGCGHVVASREFVLDEGEELMLQAGLLHVVSYL